MKEIIVPRQWALLLASMLLAACGGGGDDNSGSNPGSPSDSDGFVVSPQPAVGGSFDFLGYVDIIDDTLDDRINYDANFFAMQEPANTRDFHTVPPAQGQCRLRITNSIPSDSAAIGFPTTPFTLTGAGETFTLTSSAGTYTTIDVSQSRFEIGPYPAPENMTIDLPGGGFPAFADIDIPRLDVPSDFQSSTGRDLTDATEFTWTPGGRASVFLRMDTVAPNSQWVSMRCNMGDNGSFSLPDVVKQEFTSRYGENYSLSDARLDRIAYNIVAQGNALLVVTRRQDTL